MKAFRLSATGLIEHSCKVVWTKITYLLLTDLDFFLPPLLRLEVGVWESELDVTVLDWLPPEPL